MTSPTPAASATRPTRRARAGLLGLVLAMTLSSLATSVANIALPALADDFGVSLGQVQWVVLAYLVVTAAAVVPAGRVGDALGRRRVLVVGVVVFVVGSVLCAVAPTLWALVAARAVQGLGAAAMLALTVAVVRDTVPASGVGGAMGLLGTASAVGTALGPGLGSVLVAGPGWRWMFLVLAPLGALCIALLAGAVPAGVHDGAASRRVDVLGALALALAFTSYALAVTVASGVGAWALGALTVSALGAFVVVERRAASPMVQLRAFRDRALRTGLLLNLLVATVMMTTLVVGPFYLSGGLGLSTVLVGAVMVAGPVVSIVTGAPAGRLVDRLGASRLTVVGLALMTAGALLLAVLAPVAGVAGYLAGIVLLTPGYQLFQAANNTAVMLGTDSRHQGSVAGLLSLARNAGLVTGASVMGAVFAFGAGSRDLTGATPAAVTDGAQLAFAVTAVLVAAGATVSWRAHQREGAS